MINELYFISVVVGHYGALLLRLNFSEAVPFRSEFILI